jgi:hypothetical protein
MTKNVLLPLFSPWSNSRRNSIVLKEIGRERKKRKEGRKRLSDSKWPKQCSAEEYDWQYHSQKCKLT